MADLRFLTPITILSDIGGISIDITRKRGEVYENIITQNPVESGVPTSDHIVNLPVKVTMEGGFTDTPTTALVGPALSNLSLKGRSKDLFDQLLVLNANKKTFDMMDGLHLFKDMFFKSITENKEREGFFVAFTMEFWRIIKVQVGQPVTDYETLSHQDWTNRLKMMINLEVAVGSVSTKDALESIGILL